MKNLTMAAAALVAGLMMMGTAYAHSGGMAKDGCHKDNAVGERHWHVGDSVERGGECIKVDGKTMKVEPMPDYIKALNDRLDVLMAREDERRMNTGPDPACKYAAAAAYDGKDNFGGPSGKTWARLKSACRF